MEGWKATADSLGEMRSTQMAHNQRAKLEIKQFYDYQNSLVTFGSATPYEVKSRMRYPKMKSAFQFILAAAICASAPQSFGQTGTPPAAVDFGTPGIELQPYVINHRGGDGALIDLSFLLEAPAGRAGFIRVENGHLANPKGEPIRFWGVNLTEWTRGSASIPTKEDAPMWAATLARFGINFVRLHFLDLPAPRGMIDATRDDSQHFDTGQLDREDFFIAELLKRGIYVDWNLNVGRQYKNGDNVLATRVGKGPLLFDRRLIELQRDYARQILTHVNPYTTRAYVDEPGVALVEIDNEDAIYVGWTSDGPYDQELTDLYNDWLARNLSTAELAKLRSVVGVPGTDPIPRLKGPAVREAPAEQYYTESRFFRDLEAGYFQEMRTFLKKTLGVKSPVLATADHSHSSSGYTLVADTSLLDVVDGHTYWQHPSDRTYRHTPMVNDPLNSTVVELSRSAVAGKPYTVSEVNNPFPSQFGCEGIPILAAYAGFLDWDAVVWYTFEPKRESNWPPHVGDAFDLSLDPVKMPQLAAGALMYLRGDLTRAKITVERSYTRQQVLDSRRTPGLSRPYYTAGFPASVPLLHGSRVKSLDGEATTQTTATTTGPLTSDTNQLVWSGYSNQTGVVTIDSPRSQGLIGFVRQNNVGVTNLVANVRNNFCAIVLNALDSDSITQAGRLLLTTGTRVENTGMQWDAARARVTEQGRAPTLIEPLTGTVILRNLVGASRVSAQPLDGTGHRLGESIAAQKTAAGWEIAVGKPATTWYEVKIER
jgi:hypothetical protein